MKSFRFGNAPENEGEVVWFLVDGAHYPALPGDTIASALYAAGVRVWRRAPSGEPRGLLCGIGLCFDCLVTVNGQPGVRACLTEVQDGMIVETNLLQQGQP
jgi:predicted molibdopterin-dependent oxidoreductase YjgC